LLAAIISAAGLSGCVSPFGPAVRGYVPAAPSSAASTATPAAHSVPTTATPKPAKASARKPETSSAGTDAAALDNTMIGWSFRRNTTHTVPEIPAHAKTLTKRYGAIYVGPDPKLVYLTFDEGYENGNTPAILDTLKRDGVHATFFVTGEYCREAPKLCRRMLAEGHVVGNHSNTHPSMPSITSDPVRFKAQFTKTDASFKKATGSSLAKLFRPPMGEYSAKSLAMTQDLGYESVFWTFAHVDYDEKKQPPVPDTIKLVLSGSHPGAIFLLHAISTSDSAALDDIIKGLRAQGYDFGTL
jgi:peptidoglycan-N-acetylmuramic acid deacetylase